MKITWYIEDGYSSSKTRPHSVEVPDNILNGCENDEEKEQVIDEYVKADFENKVTYRCNWKK